MVWQTTKAYALLLLIVLAPTIDVARAEEPGEALRLAAAQKYLEISGCRASMEETFRREFDRRIPQIVADAVRGDPNIDLNAVTIYMGYLQEELNTIAPKISEKMANLYADSFDLAELQGLIAFYQSPVGQKLLQKEPELVEGAAKIGAEVGESEGALAAKRAMERLHAAGYSF